MNYWEADGLRIEIDSIGRVVLTGDNIKSEPCALALAVIDGTIYHPKSCEICNDEVSLDYGITSVKLTVQSKTTHIKITITNAAKAECVIWGPLPVSADGYAEILGAAKLGGEYLCIQSLNAKTIGGFPAELMEAHPLKEKFVDFSMSRIPMNECAALQYNGGAALQAYVRNREIPAKRDFLYAKDAEAAAIPGLGIPGSAIALFAAHEDALLDRIEQIEISENLPHPTIDGVWNKRSTRANESYLITDFGSDTIDEAILFAEKGGFRCVYHTDPFDQWGHFRLKPENFPNGDGDLSICVKRAAEKGIHIGLHTLTNFTTTNDPYVEGKPDPRLLIMGSAVLVKDLAPQDEIMYIDSGHYFESLSMLNCARLGDELIRYEWAEPSENGVQLGGLTRGMYGTSVCSHKAGDSVYRLWDHDYRVLFPNFELQRELSSRLGALLRDTGVLRLSYDGIEGCQYTGHEEFACSVFVDDCYSLYGPEVLTDASRLSHYRWHAHCYMNWGEPWYSDTRSGMFDFRQGNQAFFRRNMLPRMLGWYNLRLSSRKYEATALDDIEWIMAKAVGFESGFAYSARLGHMRKHGMMTQLLEKISMWEDMRHNGCVSEELRAEMQLPQSEWSLYSSDCGWRLHRVDIARFECSPEGAQPGMPTGADWMMANKYAAQPLKFRIRCGDGRDTGGLTDPYFSIGKGALSFKLRLSAGEYLVYEGGNDISKYDSNYNLLETVTGSGKPLEALGGMNMLSFKCRFEGEAPPYPMIKVFLHDSGILVTKKH